MTRANGAAVADTLSILTAEPRGPALLQDIWLIETLAHFDREVIPERRMHGDHQVEQDHFEQPGILLRSITPCQQQVLFENTVRAIGASCLEVRRRHVDNCAKADPAYGVGIARALGLVDAGSPG